VKKRTIVYIDGYNLYFAIKDRNWHKFLWLNLKEFAKSFILSDHELVRTKYFTSKIKKRPAKAKRQLEYLRAVYNLTEVDIYYGNYTMKKWKCNKCRHLNSTPTEKKTDVNIATEMVTDAFTDKFDTAYLVSGDSDLEAPVLSIRKYFPEKRVVVVFPQEYSTDVLKEAATAHIFVTKRKLSSNQFPQTINTSSGKILSKPTEWA